MYVCFFNYYFLLDSDAILPSAFNTQIPYLTIPKTVKVGESFCILTKQYLLDTVFL